MAAVDWEVVIIETEGYSKDREHPGQSIIVAAEEMKLYVSSSPGAHYELYDVLMGMGLEPEGTNIWFEDASGTTINFGGYGRAFSLADQREILDVFGVKGIGMKSASAITTEWIEISPNDAYGYPVLYSAAERHAWIGTPYGHHAQVIEKLEDQGIDINEAWNSLAICEGAYVDGVWWWYADEPEEGAEEAEAAILAAIRAEPHLSKTAISWKIEYLEVEPSANPDFDWPNERVPFIANHEGHVIYIGSQRGGHHYALHQAAQTWDLQRLSQGYIIDDPQAGAEAGANQPVGAYLWDDFPEAIEAAKLVSPNGDVYGISVNGRTKIGAEHESYRWVMATDFTVLLSPYYSDDDKIHHADLWEHMSELKDDTFEYGPSGYVYNGDVTDHFYSPMPDNITQKVLEAIEHNKTAASGFQVDFIDAGPADADHERYGLPVVVSPGYNKAWVGENEHGHYQLIDELAAAGLDDVYDEEAATFPRVYRDGTFAVGMYTKQYTDTDRAMSAAVSEAVVARQVTAGFDHDIRIPWAMVDGQLIFGEEGDHHADIGVDSMMTEDRETLMGLVWAYGGQHEEGLQVCYYKGWESVPADPQLEFQVLEAYNAQSRTPIANRALAAQVLSPYNQGGGISEYKSAKLANDRYEIEVVEVYNTGHGEGLAALVNKTKKIVYLATTDCWHTDLYEAVDRFDPDIYDGDISTTRVTPDGIGKWYSKADLSRDDIERLTDVAIDVLNGVQAPGLVTRQTAANPRIAQDIIERTGAYTQGNVTIIPTVDDSHSYLGGGWPFLWDVDNQQIFVGTSIAYHYMLHEAAPDVFDDMARMYRGRIEPSGVIARNYYWPDEMTQEFRDELSAAVKAYASEPAESRIAQDKLSLTEMMKWVYNPATDQIVTVTESSMLHHFDLVESSKIDPYSGWYGGHAYTDETFDYTYFPGSATKLDYHARIKELLFPASRPAESQIAPHTIVSTEADMYSYMDVQERRQLGARPIVEAMDGTVHIGLPIDAHSDVMERHGLDEINRLGVQYPDGSQWWDWTEAPQGWNSQASTNSTRSIQQYAREPSHPVLPRVANAPIHAAQASDPLMDWPLGGPGYDYRWFYNPVTYELDMWPLLHHQHYEHLEDYREWIDTQLWGGYVYSRTGVTLTYRSEVGTQPDREALLALQSKGGGTTTWMGPIVAEGRKVAPENRDTSNFAVILSSRFESGWVYDPKTDTIGYGSEHYEIIEQMGLEEEEDFAAGYIYAKTDGSDGSPPSVEDYPTYHVEFFSGVYGDEAAEGKALYYEQVLQAVQERYPGAADYYALKTAASENRDLSGIGDILLRYVDTSGYAEGGDRIPLVFDVDTRTLYYGNVGGGHTLLYEATDDYYRVRSEDEMDDLDRRYKWLVYLQGSDSLDTYGEIEESDKAMILVEARDLPIRYDREDRISAALAPRVAYQVEELTEIFVNPGNEELQGIPVLFDGTTFYIGPPGAHHVQVFEWLDPEATDYDEAYMEEAEVNGSTCWIRDAWTGHYDVWARFTKERGWNLAGDFSGRNKPKTASSPEFIHVDAKTWNTPWVDNRTPVLVAPGLNRVYYGDPGQHHFRLYEEAMNDAIEMGVLDSPAWSANIWTRGQLNFAWQRTFGRDPEAAPWKQAVLEFFQRNAKIGAETFDIQYIDEEAAASQGWRGSRATYIFNAEENTLYISQYNGTHGDILEEIYGEDYDWGIFENQELAYGYVDIHTQDDAETWTPGEGYVDMHTEEGQEPSINKYRGAELPPEVEDYLLTNAMRIVIESKVAKLSYAKDGLLCMKDHWHQRIRPRFIYVFDTGETHFGTPEEAHHAQIVERDEIFEDDTVQGFIHDNDKGNVIIEAYGDLKEEQKQSITEQWLVWKPQATWLEMFDASTMNAHDWRRETKTAAPIGSRRWVYDYNDGKVYIEDYPKYASHWDLMIDMGLVDESLLDNIEEDEERYNFFDSIFEHVQTGFLYPDGSVDDQSGERVEEGFAEMIRAARYVEEVPGDGPDWEQHGGKSWWSGIYHTSSETLHMGAESLHHEHILEHMYGPRWYNKNENEYIYVTWYNPTVWDKPHRVSPELYGVENPEILDWLKGQSPYLGQIAKTAKKIQVIEIPRSSPQSFPYHTAWIWDPKTDELFICDKDHHWTIYEYMMDKRDKNWGEGVIEGDVQEGEIRQDNGSNHPEISDAVWSALQPYIERQEKDMGGPRYTKTATTLKSAPGGNGGNDQCWIYDLETDTLYYSLARMDHYEMREQFPAIMNREDVYLVEGDYAGGEFQAVYVYAGSTRQTELIAQKASLMKAALLEAYPEVKTWSDHLKNAKVARAADDYFLDVEDMRVTDADKSTYKWMYHEERDQVVVFQADDYEERPYHGEVMDELGIYFDCTGYYWPFMDEWDCYPQPANYEEVKGRVLAKIPGHRTATSLLKVVEYTDPSGGNTFGDIPLIYLRDTNTLYTSTDTGSYHGQLYAAYEDQGLNWAAGVLEGEYIPSPNTLEWRIREAYVPAVLMEYAEARWPGVRQIGSDGENVYPQPKTAAIEGRNGIEWVQTGDSHGDGLPFFYDTEEDFLYIGTGEGFHFEIYEAKGLMTEEDYLFDRGGDGGLSFGYYAGRWSEGRNPWFLEQPSPELLEKMLVRFDEAEATKPVPPVEAAEFFEDESDEDPRGAFVRDNFGITVSIRAVHDPETGKVYFSNPETGAIHHVQIIEENDLMGDYDTAYIDGKFVNPAWSPLTEEVRQKIKTEWDRVKNDPKWTRLAAYKYAAVNMVALEPYDNSYKKEQAWLFDTQTDTFAYLTGQGDHYEIYEQLYEETIDDLAYDRIIEGDFWIGGDGTRQAQININDEAASGIQAKLRGCIEEAFGPDIFFESSLRRDAKVGLIPIKESAQFVVEESESNQPEDRHDAWVFVIPDNTIYFMHGGHHSEVYEYMVDADEVEMKGYWAGDIQNGEIRFYDHVRNQHEEEDVFDTGLFKQVMEVVKGLSQDYSRDQISIDYDHHASLKHKIAWRGSDVRWFWDQVNGFTVWRTFDWNTIPQGEDKDYYHSAMGEKLYGENWWEHDAHTGGYIYPNGAVVQTYKSGERSVNVSGLRAATKWAQSNGQLQLDPPMMPSVQAAANWEYRDYNEPNSDQDWKAIYFAEENWGVWWHVNANLSPHHYEVVDDLFDGDIERLEDFLNPDPDGPITDWSGEGTFDGTTIRVNSTWPQESRAFFAREMASQQGAEKTAAKAVDAMFKWTYPPGGPIHVWPVDEFGEPSHFQVTGWDIPDAQGHIYLTKGNVSVFTHPNRPDVYTPAESIARPLLLQEATDAAKMWAMENLMIDYVGDEDHNREFDGRQKKKKKQKLDWFHQGRRNKKPKRKRKHLRKHHYPLLLGMGDWSVVKYPDLQGALPEYPAGGQVDTVAKIEAGTHT